MSPGFGCSGPCFPPGKEYEIIIVPQRGDPGKDCLEVSVFMVPSGWFPFIDLSKDLHVGQYDDEPNNPRKQPLQ